MKEPPKIKYTGILTFATLVIFTAMPYLLKNPLTWKERIIIFSLGLLIALGDKVRISRGK